MTFGPLGHVLTLLLTDLELLENSSPYSSPFPSSKVLLQLLLRDDYMEMKNVDDMKPKL